MHTAQRKVDCLVLDLCPIYREAFLPGYGTTKPHLLCFLAACRPIMRSYILATDDSEFSRASQM